MRLWTVHPKYLDTRGLVALWREGLLAQAVLRGRTTGYRRHPQLARFRDSGAPLRSIGRYLSVVQEEAARRGYRFDRRRIHQTGGRAASIAAPLGQLEYEWAHLLAKLAARDPDRLAHLRRSRRPVAHPLFRIVPGGVAVWEVGAAKGHSPRSRRATGAPKRRARRRPGAQETRSGR